MEILEIMIRGRTLHIPQNVTLYGGESGVTMLRFTGGDASLQYKLDLCNEWNGQKNVVDLSNSGGILEAVLSGETVLPAGGYQMQLRTVGDVVWHSDPARLTVRSAIDAVDAFAAVPTEMRQIEQRVTDAKNEAERAAAGHAPQIGQNGNWQTWDYSANPQGYADTGVAAQGDNGDDAPAGRVFFGVSSDDSSATTRNVTLDERSAAEIGALQDGDVLYVRMRTTLKASTNQVSLRLGMTIGGASRSIPVYIGTNKEETRFSPPMNNAWEANEVVAFAYCAAHDNGANHIAEYFVACDLGHAKLSSSGAPGTLGMVSLQNSVDADPGSPGDHILPTRAAIKAALDGKTPYITQTVEGNPVTIADGADDVPVKDLVCKIMARQTGSGDPSPSNVRDFQPIAAVTITVNGTARTIPLVDGNGVARPVYGNPAGSNTTETPTQLNCATGELHSLFSLFQWGVYDEDWSYSPDNGGTVFYEFDRKNPNTLSNTNYACNICKVYGRASDVPANTLGLVTRNPQNDRGDQYFRFVHTNAVGVYSEAGWLSFIGNTLSSDERKLQILYLQKRDDQGNYELPPVDMSTVKTQLGANTIGCDAGAVTMTYRLDPTLAYDELKNAIIAAGQ